MCLILDINILHKVYPNANEDHAPISRALKDKKATMVYGGKLRREYLKANWFRKFLRRLDQSGAAKIVPDQEVDLRTQAIASAGGYISNDPHILALAIVANVRLVCTDDDDLAADFKNRRIIANPRGNVYRRRGHAHLIRRHCPDSRHSGGY